MKNIDDIDTITRSLARVEPGATGGRSSDAGARTLLASILAEEPGRSAAPPRRRRLTPWMATVAALATGIVVVPSLLRTGVSPSYAVTKDSDGVVYVKVRDFENAGALTEQLKELGVPAMVDYVPPGMRCREPRATYVEDIPPGLYSVPENIPGEDLAGGWQMRIDTRLFKPGQTFVWTIGGNSTSTILMNDPVAPCVLEPDRRPAPPAVDYRTATMEGRSLADFRVDEKTVGEVLPELKKRGLKVSYLIMEIAPGNPGGYGELRTQTAPVGDDWIVWEAEESIREPGLIRLLVTEERYDRNPVYGGPRDEVIKE